MEFDFKRYIEAFNAGDEEAVVNEFFTEDTIIDGPDAPLHGRQQWITMLNFMHTVVREKLIPRLVVQQGDAMMAELDAEFTAIADCPDFRFAPLKKGESVQVRFFAVYELSGAQISRLALAWWPPSDRS